MSWCLVIPFDTIKTIVQAEIDPVKRGDMTQVFKAKTKVFFSLFSFISKINDELNRNACFVSFRNTDGEYSFGEVGLFW